MSGKYPPNCECGRHGRKHPPECDCAMCRPGFGTKCNPGCTCKRHRGKTFTGTLGYFSLHERVRKERGKASDRLCEDCGASAKHWAQMHDTDGTHPLHYIAMCVSCHHKYDQIKEKSEESKRIRGTGSGWKNSAETRQRQSEAKKRYWQAWREARGKNA